MTPPSSGFAVGWDYIIGWLTVLPFELTAAGITIRFCREDLSIGIRVAGFLLLLTIIQIFDIRKYGQVKFVLSTIKVLGYVGFIIMGVIFDCGGRGRKDILGQVRKSAS